MFKSEQNQQRYRFNTFQKQDLLKEYALLNPRTRHTKRRHQLSSGSVQSSYSHLNCIKLNKGKKYLLQQQRNTEIQRSNRILHQKLARCARKSQPTALNNSKINSTNSTQAMKINSKSKSKVTRLKTNPTLQAINNSFQLPKIAKKKHNSADNLTLFLGHSEIDDVQFKIKVIISQGVYYLVAQNQHTRIVLQMPQQQYWQLHYKQFNENPCNIFQYLQIQKGQISFRIKKSTKPKRKRKNIDQLPKGVLERKNIEPSSQLQIHNSKI